MPVVANPNVLVGTETADDAAVFRLHDGLAIVQTVDFFSPIVDDAYQFGQIAAANSLSDIYAMGAEPLFALNIAGFPNKKLPLAILHEILHGGADKAAEAGIPVVGGHTVEDDEPKYGMVVTGRVDPAKITRNRGALAGDRLVLTKPLGTGIVANAAKKRECSQEILDAAVKSMSTLNRGAALAASKVGVDACTDVTGFGLVGHLRGMLLASGVAARIRASALPVLAGARDFVAKGFVPGGSKRNREFYAPSLSVEGASEIDAAILADAQTSGGLLFSVAAARADDLVRELREASTPSAAVIGEVIAGTPGSMTLVP